MNKFDDYGLRHSIEHLDIMRSKIHELSLDEQSEYADRVTIMNVNSRLIEKQIMEYEYETTEDLTYWNTTTIGNLAYIAKYCKNRNVKDKCLVLLNIYKKYNKSKTE